MTARDLSDLPDELVTALANGNALIICGAGVSTQATDGKAPGWLSLIKTALEDAKTRPVPMSQARIASCEALLADKAEPADWLRAATMIRDHLTKDKSDFGLFRSLLKDKLGRLAATAPAIIDAIRQLGEAGNIIATTNYDTLLTEGWTSNPICWNDANTVAEIVRNDEECGGVWHLHGVWWQPEYVIFCKDTYENIRSNERIQFLQQHVAFDRTLVFIGCGPDGLGDKNVGAMLENFFNNWSGLNKQHFALVKAGAETGDWPSAVTPVAYGNGYDDLPVILATLAPKLTEERRRLRSNPHMIGRQAELEALVSNLLNQHRPVIVPGSLGMGKTTLALAAVYDPRVTARFGERIYFIDLEPVNNADALLREVADCFGIDRAGSEEQLLAALKQRSEDTPTCIILDNLETPRDPDPKACDEMLAHLAGLRGLTCCITIRGDTPRIPGGGLLLSDVERLEPNEANQLFVRVAGQRFSRDPNLRAILAALDGHPLSIELIAANADGLDSLDTLLQDWRTQKTDLLKTGAADDRLTNFKVSLDLSLQRLNDRPPAVELLSLIACLPVGMNEGDLKTLAPDTKPDDLRALVRARLVRRRNGRLYIEAPPIREALLVDLGPEAEAERRLIDHFTGIAIKAGKIGTEGWSDVRQLVELEANNLNAVLTRTIAGLSSAGQASTLIDKLLTLERACSGLSEYYKFTGRGGVSSIEHLADVAKSCNADEIAANCIRSLGDIALARCRYDDAEKLYAEAKPLYEDIGSTLGTANCINSLGDIARRRSRYDDAEKLYTEAKPLYEDVGHTLGTTNCIYSLGDIALRRSRYDDAEKLYTEAKPLYEDIGDTLGTANCIRNLGDIALARSRYDDAEKLYAEAKPLYEDIGSTLGTANCIHSLGNIALRRSRYDDAEKLCAEAKPLYEDVGHTLGTANCTHSLGDIALRRSRYDDAEKLYAEAKPLYEDIGSTLGTANCIHSLGDIALRRSRYDDAEKLYTEAKPLYEDVGQTLGTANCDYGLAELARRQRDTDKAIELWRKSAEQFERILNQEGLGFAAVKLTRHGLPEEAHTWRTKAREAFLAIDRLDFIDRFVDGDDDPDSEF